MIFSCGGGKEAEPMKKIILRLVFLLSISTAAEAVANQMGDRHSPLSIEIQMTKAVYGANEELEGVIVITNASSASFPATFDIQLFHEDDLREEMSAEIKSFLPGDNKYNFKELGIPQTHPGGEGRWRLMIVQKDVNASYAATADFVVENIHDESAEEVQDGNS
jgi:hypothetical protein